MYHMFLRQQRKINQYSVSLEFELSIVFDYVLNYIYEGKEQTN